MPDAEPPVPPPGPPPGSLESIAAAYHARVGSAIGLHGPTGGVIPASTNPPAPPPVRTVREQCADYLAGQPARAGFGLKPADGFSYQRKPPPPPTRVVTPPKPPKRR
jgi:hypothetical protein